MLTSRSTPGAPLSSGGRVLGSAPSPALRLPRGKKPRAVRLLPGLLALLAWEALSRAAVLPAFVLPAPRAVGDRWLAVAADGTLWLHARTTLGAALGGFVGAALLGLILGYVLASWPGAEAIFAPYLAASQAVPVVAIAPLLVLWLGYGLASKVAVAALLVFFPILATTVVALRRLPRPLREVAAVAGASRWQLLRMVELPLALPTIMAGLKTALALATTGAVVGEFVGARAGLGVLINIGRGAFDAPLIYASLLTLVGITLGLYQLAGLLERRLVSWEE